MLLQLTLIGCIDEGKETVLFIILDLLLGNLDEERLHLLPLLIFLGFNFLFLCNQ